MWQSPIWVFTDLDGTLLDHDNYSYREALPALRKLQENGIPVVINSSKTRAEILDLLAELPLNTPYIVENGSAAYLPADWPQPLGTQAVTAPPLSERKQLFGRPRAAVLQLLRQVKSNVEYGFKGFSDMSLSELKACTGLTKEQCELAANRDYSEPLLWQDSDAALASFTADMQQRGMTVTQGGRFVHVSAPADKGTAMNWLVAQRGQNLSRPHVIALGDSENDRPMLELADTAVVVRRKQKPALELQHHNKIITDAPGPAGWNGAIQDIISSTLFRKDPHG